MIICPIAINVQPARIIPQLVVEPNVFLALVQVLDPLRVLGVIQVNLLKAVHVQIVLWVSFQWAKTHQIALLALKVITPKVARLIMLANNVLEELTTTKKVSQVPQVVYLAPLAHTLRLVQPHLATVKIVTRGNSSMELLVLVNPIVKVALLVNTVLTLREVQIVQCVALVGITIKLLKRLVRLAAKENTATKKVALRSPIVNFVQEEHTTTK